MNSHMDSLSDVIQECLQLLNRYNYLCGKIQESSTQKNIGYFVNCTEAYYCYRHCHSLVLERALKMDDFKYLNNVINDISQNIGKNQYLISVYMKLKTLLLSDLRIEWITFEYYFYYYCNFLKNNDLNGYLRSLLSHSWISMQYLNNILNHKNTLDLIIEITGNLEDSIIESTVSNKNYIKISTKFISVNETIEQLQSNLEHSLDFLVSDYILFKERSNFDYIFLITTDNNNNNMMDNSIPGSINLGGNVIKMLNLFEKIAKSLTRKKESGVYANLYFSIIEINKWETILGINKYANDNTATNTPRSFDDTVVIPKTTNGNQGIIIIGIHNQSNSCYINCTIQSLIGTVDFFNWILMFNSNEESYRSLKPLPVTIGLKKLFNDICDYNKIKRNEPVNIESFKNICSIECKQFQGNTQEDCVEFCNFLLDSLNNELKTMNYTPKYFLNKETSLADTSWLKYLSENDTIITHLFVGQVSSRLKCGICHTSSVNYEEFSILSLPIPKAITCNIMECFRQYFKEHQLDSLNQWKCIKCGMKTPSTQKMTLIKKPSILIIQLKRFDNNLIKNNCFIQYPINLNHQYTGLPINPQLNSFKYELYSVVCHRGSINNGHYSAFVYKGDKTGWYYFDDTVFRSVQTLSEIITQDAYLLFYRQVK